MKSPIKKQQAGQRIKLARIEVKVPVRHPGNAIGQVEVKFDVSYDGIYYNAIPIQDQLLARLTGLPGAITFAVENDWVTCIQPEFKYVAVDIYNELKKTDELASPSPNSV